MSHRFAVLGCCLAAGVSLSCSLVGDSGFRVVESDSGTDSASAGAGAAGSTACDALNAPCALTSDCCGAAEGTSRCVQLGERFTLQQRCREVCETKCPAGFRCELLDDGTGVCVPLP